ncbi:hypothetical protein AB1L30_06370, partial [Bremerella sp. JC817]|uniref:hypothetical protein n=1 Tax=Bremerella sp. JC817 TaxID=3231756 RepID=UPI00345B096D
NTEAPPPRPLNRATSCGIWVISTFTASALMARKRWGLGLVALLASLAVFLINVSYPEWTGGWSTGPRLLVPLLPFGMIGVAGLLAAGPIRKLGPGKFCGCSTIPTIVILFSVCGPIPPK